MVDSISTMAAYSLRILGEEMYFPPTNLNAHAHMENSPLSTADPYLSLVAVPGSRNFLKPIVQLGAILRACVW